MSGTRIEDMVYGLKENGIKSDENVTLTGTLSVTGALTASAAINATGVVNGSTAGIRTIQSVANVTEAAPTDAELDAAFGTPASLGRGFIGTIDDNDGNTASVLVWTTDSGWFHVVGTKST